MSRNVLLSGSISQTIMILDYKVPVIIRVRMDFWDQLKDIHYAIICTFCQFFYYSNFPTTMKSVTSYKISTNI